MTVPMRHDSSPYPYGSPLGVTAVKRPNNFCAWRGPSMLVVGADGWIGKESLSGFFFRETRYLSALKLEIQGDEPFPCSLAEVRAHWIESTYNYPPLDVGGGGGSGSGGEHETKGILERGLDLKVIHEVHASSLEVRLILTNRWNELAEFELAWVLNADFAGVLEAQNVTREQTGPVQRVSIPQGVKFGRRLEIRRRTVKDADTARPSGESVYGAHRRMRGPDRTLRLHHRQRTRRSPRSLVPQRRASARSRRDASHRRDDTSDS